MSAGSTKLWGQAVFSKIVVQGKRVVEHSYEEPFVSLLGSNKRIEVEERGRYSNLPASKLVLWRQLVSPWFQQTIGELHELVTRLRSR
jgi:hypothetical protein